MKIKFLGAAGMVTGSAFLLHEAGPLRRSVSEASKAGLPRGKAGILIDFGMFQGESKVMDLNFQAPGFDI
jgi:hypothetical protein